MRIHEYERCLKLERDFLNYLRLLKIGLSHYLVIITVADTGAAPYFTPECSQAMMDLGLKINMLQRYRQPYIAILDAGNVMCEECSEKLEEPLVVDGIFNNHELSVYSAGFNYMHGIGCGAMVMIDGVNYSTEKRGFNFFVFDRNEERIIDTCCFDTFQEGKRIDWINPVEPALLSFAHKYKDIQLCTISLPRFPGKYAKNITPHENRVREECFQNKRWFADIVWSSKAKTKEIWDKKLVHFCNDFNSFEEFYEAFQVPPSYMKDDGSQFFYDYSTCAVNIINGFRATTNQPVNPKRSIFIIGPSTCVCWGATDFNTFESMLQRDLNKHCQEKGFIVFNRSFYGPDNTRDILTLRTLPLKKGDIVIFHAMPIWGIPHCNLSLKSVRPHTYGEIFTDVHYSKNGNRMIADGIFEFLQKNNFFEQNLPADVGTPIHMNKLELEDTDGELRTYKDKLVNFYKRTISPKVGSIVMNCNPFTKGHRYLVEQALKYCDYLIVFVVEEDKSVFPFAERIDLVRRNLTDLKNVFIIPSSQFIISSRTFKEYFNKESLQEHRIDTSLDVNMFGKEIAPCLNITMRFAGDEPLDNVTRQYNESMARILPQYGVKFIEIPRMKYKGQPVSASEVRNLTKAKQFDKLKKIVPPLTLQYLRRKISQS